MTPLRTVDLVLVWHMHQPDYRDPLSGEYRQPWVYLHAIKDYADMAAHLEAQPAMRAVVNFVPVLLEQLEDYATQFASGALRDPLLRLLAKPVAEPFSAEERAAVLGQCFHANHGQLIAPYPAYRRLHELALAAGDDARDPAGYLSDRYLADLVTWYHLAWTGETVRRAHPLLPELLTVGTGFSDAQRAALLATIGEVIASIVPRYRRLEEAGVIELTTSPATHPIGPLLLDFACAREARPDLPLPEAACYPGGRERLDRQIDDALDRHASRFGRAATGLWPPEGAVSDAFVRALDGRSVRWIASGSQVLGNSLRRAGRELTPAAMARPYRLPALAPDVMCLFRDDLLSDLIGFEYRKWHSGDAARHFVGELESLALRTAPAPRPLVTVIIDGENAWEYYPYNGYFFLKDLVRAPRRARVDPTVHDARVDGLARGEPRRRRVRSVRRAAGPRRRQLGVRRSHDVDRLDGQEPGVGPAVRGQGRLRRGARRRRSRAGAGRGRDAPPRGGGELRLDLVVRRLQPRRVGGALRCAVPGDARAPVPDPGRRASGDARHAGLPRQRHRAFRRRHPPRGVTRPPTHPRSASP